MTLEPSSSLLARRTSFIGNAKGKEAMNIFLTIGGLIAIIVACAIIFFIWKVICVLFEWFLMIIAGIWNVIDDAKEKKEKKVEAQMKGSKKKKAVASKPIELEFGGNPGSHGYKDVFIDAKHQGLLAYDAQWALVSDAMIDTKFKLGKLGLDISSNPTFIEEVKKNDLLELFEAMPQEWRIYDDNIKWWQDETGQMWWMAWPKEIDRSKTKSKKIYLEELYDGSETDEE